MLTRRGFLGSIALPSAAILAAAAQQARGDESFDLESWRVWLEELAETPGEAAAIAQDESYWAPAQQAFAIDRSMINLNNGGCSPSPRVVLDAMRRHWELSNNAPTYYMWRILEPQRETVREAMARQWGALPEEIAFTRNASESLQICQCGIDLQAGDEVLTTSQDYPRMLNTFRQLENRRGIKLVLVKLPVPCENEDAMIRVFQESITPRTRMILISHVINLRGQVLPVKRIVAMARARNIPVIVDGAHALAHLVFRISDLECDYYGVSLHKWLFAPHGTGLLYVRQARIKDLWPLMAPRADQAADIRKFEEIGTHPAAPALAIGEALNFYQAMGAERKWQRMLFLRDYWIKGLLAAQDGAAHPVRLHSSLDPRFSCGIGTFQLDGLDSGAVGYQLWDKHRIHVTNVKHDEFEGLRVTPSVYTSLTELDRFIDAMVAIMKNGLPS